MSTFVPGHRLPRADHGAAFGLTIASLSTSESFLKHSLPHCKRPRLWPLSLYQLRRRRVGQTFFCCVSQKGICKVYLKVYFKYWTFTTGKRLFWKMTIIVHSSFPIKVVALIFRNEFVAELDTHVHSSKYSKCNWTLFVCRPIFRLQNLLCTSVQPFFKNTFLLFFVFNHYDYALPFYVRRHLACKVYFLPSYIRKAV